MEFALEYKRLKHTPAGLRVRTKCHALCKELTDVEDDFRNATKETEEEYIELQAAHCSEVYTSSKAQLGVSSSWASRLTP